VTSEAGYPPEDDEVRNNGQSRYQVPEVPEAHTPFSAFGAPKSSSAEPFSEPPAAERTPSEPPFGSQSFERQPFETPQPFEQQPFQTRDPFEQQPFQTPQPPQEDYGWGSAYPSSEAPVNDDPLSPQRHPSYPPSESSWQPSTADSSDHPSSYTASPYSSGSAHSSNSGFSSNSDFSSSPDYSAAPASSDAYSDPAPPQGPATDGPPRPPVQARAAVRVPGAAMAEVSQGVIAPHNRPQPPSEPPAYGQPSHEQPSYQRDQYEPTPPDRSAHEPAQYPYGQSQFDQMPSRPISGGVYGATAVPQAGPPPVAPPMAPYENVAPPMTPYENVAPPMAPYENVAPPMAPFAPQQPSTPQPAAVDPGPSQAAPASGVYGRPRVIGEDDDFLPPPMPVPAAGRAAVASARVSVPGQRAPGLGEMPLHATTPAGYAAPDTGAPQSAATPGDAPISSNGPTYGSASVAVSAPTSGDAAASAAPTAPPEYSRPTTFPEYGQPAAPPQYGQPAAPPQHGQPAAPDRYSHTGSPQAAQHPGPPGGLTDFGQTNAPPEPQVHRSARPSWQDQLQPTSPASPASGPGVVGRAQGSAQVSGQPFQAGPFQAQATPFPGSAQPSSAPYGQNPPIAAPAFGEEPAPSGSKLKKWGWIGLTLLIVLLAAGALYYTSRPNPPTYDVGTCVRESGGKAAATPCSDSSAYQIVSKVNNRSQCPDPKAPYATISGRVLCLKKK
jgi:hypothetical protein